MTAVDALRELLSLIHEADVRAPTALPDHEWQATWDEAVTNAGAALAEAEKGESELVKTLREAGEQIERSALNIRSASGGRAAKYHFDLHARITAILAKHATTQKD